MNVLVRGGDERLEQRMWLVRLALKFGMELARHKKWMVFEFDDFDELAVGRIAAQNESGFLEFFTIGVVESQMSRRVPPLSSLSSTGMPARQVALCRLFSSPCAARRAWR